MLDALKLISGKKDPEWCGTPPDSYDIRIRVIKKKNPHAKGYKYFARVAWYKDKNGAFPGEILDEDTSCIKYELGVYDSEYQIGTPEGYFELKPDCKMDEGWYRPIFGSSQGYFDLYPERTFDGLEPIKNKH